MEDEIKYEYCSEYLDVRYPDEGWSDLRGWRDDIESARLDIKSEIVYDKEVNYSFYDYRIVRRPKNINDEVVETIVGYRAEKED